MLKVMTIVGTRPEIIRLSRVIAKLDRHCDHVLVHTGQNYDYELNEVFFERPRHPHARTISSKRPARPRRRRSATSSSRPTRCSRSSSPTRC